MAVPTSTLWPLDPHTAVKHQILRWYLQAWFPILGSFSGRLVYFEGFAGPGEYEGAEPGSPLVALDAALEQSAYLSKEVVFYLVEANEERAEHLRGRIEERRAEGLPSGFSFEVRCAEFASELGQVLDELDKEGLTLAPTFAFIDPFGFKGLPMQLMHRLLQYPQTEVFINFPVDPVNRFLNHPNTEINDQMVELFGTEKALEVQAASGKRYEALRQLYQHQLSQAAEYVRFFSMYRADNQPIYDLFFASNNLTGLAKMKEAMWRVDPEGAFRFTDATDPSQIVLFGADTLDYTDLLAEINEQFEGQTGVDVNSIENWVKGQTSYLGKHMRQALLLGQKQNTFIVQPLKRNGQRRRRNTFPSDVVIDFIKPTTPPEGTQTSLFG